MRSDAARLCQGLCVLLWAVVPVARAGLLEGEPFAHIEVERDSNVFRYADENEAVAVSGDPTLDDIRRTIGVGAALRYTWSLQRLLVGGEIRRSDYNHFKSLNNDAYEYRVAHEWRAGRLLSGVTSFQQKRDLENVVDRNTPLTGSRDEKKVELTGNLAMTPRWQLQTNLGGLRTRYSLATSQSNDLDENKAGIGLNYLGQPVSLVGIGAEFTRGDFIQRDPASLFAGGSFEYRQYDLKLRAGYFPSPLSSLRSEAGLTIRDNEGPNVTSFKGFTGRTSYERRFSPLTVLKGELYRELMNYENANANYVEDTGVLLGFEWQVVQPMGLFANLRWYTSDFEGSPALVAVAGVPREDETLVFDAGLKYKPFFWLTLKPGVAYEKRKSNDPASQYESTAVGLDVEARYD